MSILLKSLLWPCFVPEIALFRKIFWPFCPVLETPYVRPHPVYLLSHTLIGITPLLIGIKPRPNLHQLINPLLILLIFP